MLPLDHFKHTSNSGTIQASNSFDFHEWLDALYKSLPIDGWHVNQLYLALLEGEACHISGDASTHIGEDKYVQFIP